MSPALHIERVYFGPARLQGPEEAYRHDFDALEWAHVQAQQHTERRKERLFGRWWIKHTLISLDSPSQCHHHSLDPQLRCRGAQCPFVLSLAHTGGWCFAIIARTVRVRPATVGIGCDLELCNRLSHTPRGVHHPHDCIAPERRPLLWCIKEACFKALPPDPHRRPTDIRVIDPERHAYCEQWHCTYDVMADNHFVYALAIATSL